MKKFLSVLLALAVAFTFTFGSSMSAFADVTNNDTITSNTLALVNEVESMGLTAVKDNGDVAYSSTWTVKEANWELAYAKAFDNLTTAVVNVGTATDLADVSGTPTDLQNSIAILKAIGVEGITAASTKAQVKLAIVDYLTNTTNGKTYVADAAAPALIAQLAADKDAAIAAVATVDTSIYSTTVYTADTKKAGYPWKSYKYVSGTNIVVDKDCYVAKDIAESVKTAVTDGLKTVGDTTGMKTVAEATTAKANLTTLFNASIQLNGDTHNAGIEDADETWTYTLKNTAILTSAVETADSASDAAAVAAGKATIASNIAAFKRNNAYLNASTDEKAAYDAYLAAYETAETYLVENGVAGHPAGTIATPTDQAIIVANVKLAATAKEDAEAYKAETNNDGSVKYDAKIVDANLKSVLTAIYGSSSAYSYTKTALIANNAEISYVTVASKTSLKAVLADALDEENLKLGETSYYDLEFKAVKAAAEAFNTAIDAAKTSKDVTDATNAYNKAIDDIDTAAEVLAYFTGAGKLNATVDAEKVKLDAYAASLAAQQGTTDPLVFDITDTGKALAETGADGTLIRFYIDNNARTKDEITALYSAAKAVLDGAKTTSALKSEAAAVVAKIAALPAKAAITTADKAAIVDAYDAYDKLNAGFKKYVTNKTTLDTAITAVKTAEMNAILKAVKVLPAVSAVTVADKAAVKAAADMIDAYNETEMYNVSPKYTNATVNALVDKIIALELDALKAAVKAIPAAKNITAADEATIKAARAAYDEFLANYGDLLADEQNAALLTALEAAEKTIVAAEETVAPLVEAEKWTATDVKASLFDSSRKLTIWRTSKTSIRVTSVGSVADIKDHGYTVEYKFYKKAPGAASYKLVKTTSSNKYTYTNLKKGTNKFQVKVKVYDADGKLVATKMTYYRAAKIK